MYVNKGGVEMKYFPTMCGNETMKNILKKQKISDCITPVFEMVNTVAPRKDKRGYFGYWADMFNNYDSMTVVDIPMEHQEFLGKMEPEYRQFFTDVYTKPDFRVNTLNKFDISDKVIPTLSHNPSMPYSHQLIDENSKLSKNFKRKAVRLFTSSPIVAYEDCKKILNENDILFVDIHENTAEYATIMLDNARKVKADTNCHIVIKQTSVGNGYKNTELPDSKITKGTKTYEHIKHSLYIEYKNLGFDGFSDYVGVRKYTLKNIPIVSPGFLIFDNSDGSYYGYKGTYDDLDSYLDIIKKYEKSIHWKNIKNSHRKICEGCKVLDKMISTRSSYKSAPKWKRVSMSHYIASIDEVL